MILLHRVLLIQSNYDGNILLIHLSTGYGLEIISYFRDYFRYIAMDFIFL